MARWAALIFVAIVFVGLVTVGIWQARKHLPKPDEWARLLEAELSKVLKVPVKIESTDLGLTGATIKNLQIQPDFRSPTGYILTVPEIQLRWSLKQILQPSQWKQLVRAQIERTLNQIVVTNATLFLWRDRSGRWNIQPFLARRPSRLAAQVPTLRVEKSTLIIGDETLPLPSGLPFRLKLVNVQATLQPVKSGNLVKASGQIIPPLGSPNSQANLTIVQIVDETRRETQGRLTATEINLAHLPKQIRTLVNGWVNLTGGTIAELSLNWRQTDGETDLSGAAKLRDALLKLRDTKAQILSPLQASLSFSLLLNQKQVRNWHLTIRTIQTHPQFGDGILAAEGRRNFWQVRWRGENLPVNTLHLLAPQTVPIRDGILSGSVSIERQRGRTRVDTEVTIRKFQLHPFGGLEKLQVPVMSISFAGVRASIERQGSRWEGIAEVSAKSEVGKVEAKIWLDGIEGRAKTQVTNLQLKPFRSFVLRLTPTQFRPYFRLQGGLVSGNFTVSWQGRKVRLEELDGRIHQVAIAGDKIPPVRLNSQVKFDNKVVRLSQLQVQLNGSALAVLSGGARISQTPLWQVQGQISSNAMEKLAAWARAKWNLPAHLIRGGQTQIGIEGIGSQWQVQMAWSEPLGLVNLQGLKWQTSFDKLSLFATPRGAFVAFNEATAKPSTAQAKTRNLTWQLLDGIKFSEWVITWDEKRKSLTALGSVKIQQIDLDGIKIRDGGANLELAFSVTEKPSAELRALNLRAKIFGGELSDGHLILLVKSKDEFSLNSLLRLQSSDIGELVRWLKKRSDLGFSAEGQFNGEVAISTVNSWRREVAGAKRDGFKGGRHGESLQQSPETRLAMQVTVIGTVSQPKVSDDSWELRGQRLTLTALTISAEQTSDKWSFRQVAGEGVGRNFALKSGGREVNVERLQLQSVAKQSGEGWFWEFRLPQIQTLGGRISGQGKMSPHLAEGHFSFSNLDVSQVSRFVDLGFSENYPEGKGSGWFRFEARKGSNGWKGVWEGAALLEDSSWQDWSVKVAAARAEGQFVVGEKANLEQLSGKVKGIHIVSEDGQAVLDGKFSFRQDVGLVSLQGKWAGLSLKRLSRKFDLPVQLQGFAEGTLNILWDGKWQVSGTIKSQRVAVGEFAIWHDVFGEWLWSGDEVQIKRATAKWSEGTLTAEGAFRISPNAPVNLTVQGDRLALSDLSQLLREWKFPLSDWRWRGQTNARLWVSGTRERLQVTLSLNGQKVSLGSAELGELGFDLTVVQQRQKGEPLVSAKGIANLQRNGTALTAELEGKQPIWKVSWHGGNIPINALREIAKEWQRQGEREVDALEQWLKLPVTGSVWTKGNVSIVESQIADLQATFFTSNLRGLGDLPIQANLTVLRREREWTVRLNELRRGSANAFGSIAIADDGKLAGDLRMEQVPSELAASLLALFGVKVESESLPEGSLSAHLKLAGNRENPVVEGTLQAREVYWHGWGIRQIFVRRFELREGVVRVEKGDGMVHWRTGSPSASFWGWAELKDKRRMHWQVELPPTPLDAILPSDLPLQIERGWLSGSLALLGSLKEPSLKGSIEMVADKISLASLNSLPKPFEPLTKLENLRCQIVADGRTARLTKLEANFSGGTVTGSGWLEPGEGGLQNLFSNKGELKIVMRGVKANWNGTSLNIHSVALKGNLSEKGLGLLVEQLQGDGLRLQGSVQWQRIPQNGWAWLTGGRWDLKLQFDGFQWQVKGAKGKLSGYLVLMSDQANAPPTLKGNLTVHDGDVVRLPVAATGGNGKWQLPQETLQLALRLEIGDRFFLRNPQASLLLDGELSLAGDLSQPRLEGELRSQRGTLRLPASVLTITDMSVRVAYSVDPLTRRWLGTARMRVEGETQLDIHRILFTVSGPVDEQSQRIGILPSVTMLAIPPLPEQTALERMFGLGLAQLGETLGNWQQLFSGTFVQSFMGNLLAPVTEPIAQALRWTELSVVREQTTGRQWLRLGIPIASRLHVLWRQGFSSADPSALEVQYYLGKRTSVTIIKREREQAEIRVQTSARF